MAFYFIHFITFLFLIMAKGEGSRAPRAEHISIIILSSFEAKQSKAGWEGSGNERHKYTRRGRHLSTKSGLFGRQLLSIATTNTICFLAVFSETAWQNTRSLPFVSFTPFFLHDWVRWCLVSCECLRVHRVGLFSPYPALC